MKKQLNPCPVCGRTPDRFFVSGRHIEVIACPNGCKLHSLGQVIHVTSNCLEPDGYTDLADVWNSMELKRDDDGNLIGGAFYLYPKALMPVDPSGPWNKWSPQIQKRRAMERAAANKADVPDEPTPF